MKHISIAIDGPAGAGKSTLARQAAQRLGFLYVDTGAIYRTVALKALESSADPADPEQVVPLLDGLNVKMDHGPDGGQRMFLDGKDVSDAIRQHRVSGAASQVAAIPQVREFLLDFQRRQAREHDVLMDGRDIGTVVLPDADVKIFLTAAPEVRAMRRFRELEQRGTSQPYDQVLREIVDRDYADTHRAIAPLRRAEDAVELDTGALTFEESLHLLLETIRRRAKL